MNIQTHSTGESLMCDVWCQHLYSLFHQWVTLCKMTLDRVEMRPNNLQNMNKKTQQTIKRLCRNIFFTNWYKYIRYRYKNMDCTSWCRSTNKYIHAKVTDISSDGVHKHTTELLVETQTRFFLSCFQLLKSKIQAPFKHFSKYSKTFQTLETFVKFLLWRQL